MVYEGMAMIHLCANGPSFALRKEDLPILREKNRISFPLNKLDKILGELILTPDYPNRIILPNGYYSSKDHFCSHEYFLKRTRKKNGTTEYKLKARKDSFFKDVEDFLSKRIELMGSRCRYDRFAVIIEGF
jgi:hypothetical protein